MTPPRTNWRSAPKAKSVEEIKARYKVYRNVKTEKMHIYACQLYRNQLQTCPFLVRWNVQSGQVWESGVHNHGPEAYPHKVIYKAQKEWHRLAKANSFLEIRHQYLVRKSCTRGDYFWFQCISYKRDKCPYLMRWNFKTGELFETEAHNHAKVSASRMRIRTEWQLLDGNSANITIREICRRFCVTKIGNRSPKRQYWFKCSKCNGKKCGFRLRWEQNDGNILWNGQQQCQHAKKEKGSIKKKKRMLIEEPKDEKLQQNQQQEDSDQNENASSLEIQIVEELNHDFKCPPLPAMKLEAATEKEKVVLSTAAGAGKQTSLPLSTIDGETETQLQFWHPKLRPVKKEEPKDVEEPAPTAATVILTGRKEVADQAPRKMLLRERKRPPNYAEFDGNKKKRTLRRAGTKK